VIVATNRMAHQRQTFVIRSITGRHLGPGGRDGYIHIDDARELLRLKDAEVSEIAIRLNDPASSTGSPHRSRTRWASAQARQQSVPGGASAVAGEGLARGVGQEAAGPSSRCHTWADLSPFASLAHDRPDDGVHSRWFWFHRAGRVMET